MARALQDGKLKLNCSTRFVSFFVTKQFLALSRIDSVIVEVNE